MKKPYQLPEYSAPWTECVEMRPPAVLCASLNDMDESNLYEEDFN